MKKRSLPGVLPEGQVVNRAWLYDKGFDRPAVDFYLRSGRLVAVGRGYYRRPGPPLKWQHVLYSLTELGFDIHIGGHSALRHGGVTHYVSAANQVDLYGCDSLPQWCQKVTTNSELAYRGRGGFPCGDSVGIDAVPFGTWEWQLPLSAPERALLETLVSVTDTSDFHAIDKLFESAVSLRPKTVQAVLEAAKSVKAKRLFCWYSERHSHSWFNHVSVDNVDFGSGKRQIVPQGRLNNRYQITVPIDMEAADEESLY